MGRQAFATISLSCSRLVSKETSCSVLSIRRIRPSSNTPMAKRLSRGHMCMKPFNHGFITNKPTERLLLLQILQEIVSVGLFYRLPHSNCQRCKLSDKPFLLSTKVKTRTDTDFLKDQRERPVLFLTSRKQKAYIKGTVCFSSS